MTKASFHDAGRSEIAEGLPAGLYPVAVPIGNPLDITLRAVNVLRRCDTVICEEYREGIRLLKALGIEKPLKQINEHTKSIEIRELFEELLIRKDKAVALISDAGTPCFADPGAELVRLCHEFGVAVYPVPGASSLMAALMASGLKSDRFMYYGFLSAKKEERQAELKQLKSQSGFDIVFLEAPYRLKSVLEDMKKLIGGKRSALLFYKLTTPRQQIISGSLEELSSQAESLPKGEFVLILEHESHH